MAEANRPEADFGIFWRVVSVYPGLSGENCDDDDDDKGGFQ